MHSLAAHGSIRSTCVDFDSSIFTVTQSDVCILSFELHSVNTCFNIAVVSLPEQESWSRGPSLTGNRLVQVWQQQALRERPLACFQSHIVWGSGSVPLTRVWRRFRWGPLSNVTCQVQFCPVLHTAVNQRIMSTCFWLTNFSGFFFLSVFRSKSTICSWHRFSSLILTILHVSCAWLHV